MLEKTNTITLIDIVLEDMGFDDENNHVGARKIGTAATIIPTGHADVPIYRTSGIHRKETKGIFPKQSYSQRNKSETEWNSQKGDEGNLSKAVVFPEKQI